MFISKRLLGSTGEGIAALVLMSRGYWPVAFHYHHPAAEIDLICRRGRDLILVEVKTRRTWTAHDNALSHAQNQRQEKAKADLQAKYPQHTVRRAVVSIAKQWPFIRLTFV